jgi:hypothetical protein
MTNMTRTWTDGIAVVAMDGAEVWLQILGDVQEIGCADENEAALMFTAMVAQQQDAGAAFAAMGPRREYAEVTDWWQEVFA